MATSSTYYRIELTSKSAFSIGAADSYLTDSDLVLDTKGQPMVPASSIRGACRNWFGEKHGKALRDGLFGSLEDGDNNRLRFFDATYLKGNSAVSVRDSVKLKDDEKIAEKGLKFDRQIAEPGTVFVAYAEAFDEDAAMYLEEMVGAIEAGSVRFGAKSTRGFGEMGVRCLKRSFDLSNNEQRKAWLGNVMFDPDWWEGLKPIDLAVPNCSDVVVNLELKVKGAISIREYSTTPRQPDFAQLSIRFVDGVQVGSEDGGTEDGERVYCESAVAESAAPCNHAGNSEGLGEDTSPSREDWDDKPIIPGTSWAGAFRNRYREFARAIGKVDDSTSPNLGFVEELFGTVRRDESGNEVISKSRITFSESIVDGGEWKEITRNAIDRFTGGTVEHALFTERTHYGGTTRLQLRIEGLPEEKIEEHLRLLLFAIADLHFGFMAVGGLTSVGHGLFSVTSASVRYKGLLNEGFEKCLGKPQEAGAEIDRFLGEVLAAKVMNDGQKGEQ